MFIKFVLLLVFVAIPLAVCALYFFGWKKSGKAATIGTLCTLTPSALLVIIACCMVDDGLTRFILLIFALSFYLISPFVGLVVGLVYGKKYKGPYQKLSGGEKRKFWGTVRKVGKGAVLGYAAWASRTGSHNSAQAARIVGKIL